MSEYIRWKPTDEYRIKFCDECPYPRCKVSKDENLDFLLDLMDEYVACREAVEKETLS